ncbi:MAG: alpha-L-fucosidase [Clostridia bacterium]|nr:alpha-L-fucosidase [Clostridia bacterium]
MDRKAYLAKIDEVIAAGPWHADWESLATHPVPAWYGEKRLGIFLHWGPFSVPAYHDWYARNMYIQGSEEYEHHLKHWGKHKDFGYKDFIPMFKMENYAPEEWARLFREAGADYVVPVAEHHDGFQNYGSELSRWNAVDMGPHRDITGDLLNACEKEGMTRGVSSHRVEHWFFLSHGREFDSDVGNPPDRDSLYWPAMPEPADHHDLFAQPYPTQEFLEDWLMRCCELVDRMKPAILYFDWWIEHDSVKPYLQKFAAYYYNRAEEWGGCVINYKHDAFPFGVAVADMERGSFAEPKPFLWQSDTSVMRHSWCYSEQPGKADYKSPAEIIQTLADVVAKNGRLLLNFGPKPDGTFREKDLEVLSAMAAWMRDNGEAIHGTQLWRICGEGPTKTEEGQFSDGAAAGWTSQDFRFMCRGNRIYAINMVCPEDGKIRITSLRHSKETGTLPLFHGIIEEVKVLGMAEEPAWQRTEEALEVDLGPWRSDMPVVVRVRVK